MIEAKSFLNLRSGNVCLFRINFLLTQLRSNDRRLLLIVGTEQFAVVALVLARVTDQLRLLGRQNAANALLS